MCQGFFWLCIFFSEEEKGGIAFTIFDIELPGKNKPTENGQLVTDAFFALI